MELMLGGQKSQCYYPKKLLIKYIIITKWNQLASYSASYMCCDLY